MNCFQIIIFVLRRTAICRPNIIKCSCELLSNHYLCAKKNSQIFNFQEFLHVVNCFQIIIFVLRRTASNHYLCAKKNSHNWIIKVHCKVVNCFQIIIFVLRRTARRNDALEAFRLWIAFKSAGYIRNMQEVSCELLSNHYLCAKKNSSRWSETAEGRVVNCFQIIIFVLRRTAFMRNWWKGLCCELLSNHYLCAKKNS